MTCVLLVLLVALQVATPAGQSAGGKAEATAAPTPERVEIVLYSDFQCPFCAAFAPAIRNVQEKGIDGVETTITFKNFPLPMHSNAQLAAQAAMAAKAQSKFWEYHDLLFSNQSKEQRSDLIGYAKELKLDLPRFEKDMDSDAVKRQIAADVAEGTKLGVSGTPSYTINGKLRSGTMTLPQLTELVAGDQRRTRALAEVGERLMAKGPPDAPVTLELFADLESPVSRPTLAVIDQVLARYPATVRLQFRNFPLAFHPQAALAHEAAMTAARDGHFWEFASFILDHQSSLREQDLIAYASQLGLDQTKFAATLQQHRYGPRVEADLMAGQTRGIRGSPVILVNGQRIDGVPNLKTLTEDIDAALNVVEKPETPARNQP